MEEPFKLPQPLEAQQLDLPLPFTGPTTKPKLAPRSSLQFKVGPQFTATSSTKVIVDSMGQVVEPVLTPRIDRGLEVVEHEWVGYKRNYFTLVSSFYFSGMPFHYFTSEKFSVLDENTKKTSRIRYFGLRLISRCEGDRSNVRLIQHTAKRDRGPQFAPQDQIVVPGDLPPHDVIREAANVRNNGKIARLDKVFFFDRSTPSNGGMNVSGLKHYPMDKISRVARFERVQFASSINFKKTSPRNKRFLLVVELLAYTEHDPEGIPVAFSRTPPLIIRGRSPSNYSGSQDLVFGNQEVDEPLCRDLELLYDGDIADMQTYEILKEATYALGAPGSSTLAAKRKTGRKKAAQAKKLKSTAFLVHSRAISKVAKPKKEKRRSKQRERRSKLQLSEIPANILLETSLNRQTNESMVFPTTFSNPCQTFEPLTPMMFQQNKQNTTDFSPTRTNNKAPTGDENIFDEDISEYSFDTSFGLEKLFRSAGAPIPSFKRDVASKDMSPLQDMDVPMDLEQELNVMKKSLLRTTNLISLTLEVSELTNPSASLVNYGEFDEFLSFNLGFNF